MATLEQIREKLENIAKSQGPAVSNIAKVKSVDEQKALCVLVDEDGQELFNVRLRPVVSDNKSFLLVPKIDSYVLAIRIEDKDDWMVIATDQVVKVGYYINSTIFEIDDMGFLLKKENESLKKILVDLVKAIQQIQLIVNTTGTATAQAGQTTNLVNLSDFLSLETRINQFLK